MRIGVNKFFLGAVVSTIFGNAFAVSYDQRNDDWMLEMSAQLSGKKLSEIVIPGTHDSGTSGIGGANGNVARTQKKTIGQQLDDGIRYFDLRVTENAHRDCADPSVWWIHHGERDSYRFTDAINQVKVFLKNPGHEKELIILDIQDITLKYSDARAANVLLGYLQKELGGLDGYLLNKNSKNYSLADPVGKIWDYNNKFKKSRQVIALVPGWSLDIADTGCGYSVNKSMLYSRDQYIYGYYREVTDVNGKKVDVDGLLFRGSSVINNMTGQFNQYREKQRSGGLTVLNFAPRPSDGWYATAWADFSGFALYNYANYEINYPLNVIENKKCYEGWLGKRLYMSYNASNLGSGLSEDFNRPNIVMIDAYDAWQGWANVYLSNGSWRFQRKGSFVDFIKAINDNPYPARVGSFSYNDGQCL